MSTAIFHLVPPAQWPPDGTYRPESLDDEGFVHFSYADQVAGSADRHFAAECELLAVEVDPALLDAPLRVEDSYGSGTAFPHVYGAIEPAAVRRVHRLSRGADGRWRFELPGPTV